MIHNVKLFSVNAVLVIGLLGTASADATVIYTHNRGDTDARNYTTFNAGGTLGGTISATNSNTGTNNTGPGFSYNDTGIAIQANTTYTIDVTVYNRGGQPDDAPIQFGLFDGLPGDDNGGGAFANGGSGATFDAGTHAVLGTVGSAVINTTQVPNDDTTGALASSLTGANAGTFTTGADVSGLGNLIVFIRTTADGTASGRRAHWLDLTIDAEPVPEPSSLALLGLGGLAMIRRRK
ncbi:MAG: PEP-CTERM sorting domain-containing protein [Planctomycetota bacterium]